MCAPAQLSALQGKGSRYPLSFDLLLPFLFSLLFFHSLSLPRKGKVGAAKWRWKSCYDEGNHYFFAAWEAGICTRPKNPQMKIYTIVQTNQANVYPVCFQLHTESKHSTHIIIPPQLSLCTNWRVRETKALCLTAHGTFLL